MSQVKTATAVTTPPSRGIAMPLTLQEAQAVITGAHERAAKMAAWSRSRSSTKADTCRPSAA